jgi:hypothetical protein
LRCALTAEARHLDLRWARDESDLDLRNSRFRSAVADLAAPMLGIPKDELEGEDIRLHRRARLLARTGVSVLAALLVVAIIFGVYAVNQRNRADLATDDALAGGLSVKAGALLGAGQHDLAALVAVEANNAASHLPASSPSVGDARDDLLRVLAAQPQLSRTLFGPRQKLTGVVYSPDGATIVAQYASGALRAWNAATGAPTAHQPPPTNGASLTGMVLNDAGVLAIPDGSEAAGVAHFSTRLWDLKTGRSWRWQPPYRSHFGTVLALSDDGLLATTTGAPTASNIAATNTIALWNINTGRRVVRPIAFSGSVDALAFSRDGTRLGADLITPDSSQIDLVVIDTANGVPVRAP